MGGADGFHYYIRQVGARRSAGIQNRLYFRRRGAVRACMRARALECAIQSIPVGKRVVGRKCTDIRARSKEMQEERARYLAAEGKGGEMGERAWLSLTKSANALRFASPKSQGSRQGCTAECTLGVGMLEICFPLNCRFPRVARFDSGALFDFLLCSFLFPTLLNSLIVPIYKYPGHNAFTRERRTVISVGRNASILPQVDR